MQPGTLNQTRSVDGKTPAVSVIIPAYNVAPFIVETLDSVMAQTFTDFETIVINDGSPDTEELERALEPYRDRVVYLKQENGGAGAARNTGLRAARGKFIAFLDGDDVWLPNFMEEQVKFIESNGGYDLVYANASIFGDGAWTGRTYMDRDPSEGEVNLESLIGERCLVITSAVVARKEPILEVGLFDETLRNSQDFDLWVRLARRKGARMNYQRKILLKHRNWAGSLASDGIKSVEGELKVLHKVREWSDLTAAERKTLEKTIAMRKASVSVDRGKRHLSRSEFAAATESFRYAYEYYGSWKLKLVLWLLHLAPQSLQWIYKWRSS